MPKVKVTRLSIEIPTSYYLELKEVAKANIVNPVTFIEKLVCSAAIECAKLEGDKNRIIDVKANFTDEDLANASL